jgi:transposase-like protein
MRRRRWTITEARAALAALGESGLTTSAFARREGLHQERLRRWGRRLADERHRQAAAAAPDVIELRPRRPEPVEIILASGRILRVSESIDVDALARLVAALERP